MGVVTAVTFTPSPPDSEGLREVRAKRRVDFARQKPQRSADFPAESQGTPYPALAVGVSYAMNHDTCPSRLSDPAQFELVEGHDGGSEGL